VLRGLRERYWKLRLVPRPEPKPLTEPRRRTLKLLLKTP
jgi:hypothetical protein